MKSNRMNSSVVTIFIGLSLAGCQAEDHGKGVDTDSGSFSMNSVCFKDSIGIAGFNRAQIGIAGNVKVGGDLFVAPRSSARIAGNPTISGTVYEDSNADVSVAGSPSISGGIVSRDLGVEDELLQEFGKNLASLKATQHLDSVTSRQTINGNGKLNVIEIKGDVSLSGRNALVLSGSEKDVFILNVYGAMSFTGQSQVALSGGVKAQNVVIHAVGTGSDLQLAGGATLAGSYLAEARGAQIAGNMALHGAVIATNQIQIAGNGVQVSPRPFCVDVSQYVDHTPAPTPSATGSDDSNCTGSTDSSGSTSTGTGGTTDPSPTPSASPSVSPSPSPSSSPLPCTSLVCGGGTLGV